MELLEFTAADEEAGVRIDRCLSDKYEDLSRSYLQKLLKDQGVTRQWEDCKSKLQTAGRGSGADHCAGFKRAGHPSGKHSS